MDCERLLREPWSTLEGVRLCSTRGEVDVCGVCMRPMLAQRRPACLRRPSPPRRARRLLADAEMAPSLVLAATLRGHQGAVNCVTFNSDGGYAMTGGEDRVVRLWNPHRGEAASTPIKEYRVHNQRVLDVTIAADNASFASCGGDRTVFVWDVTSGLVTRRLQGHEQRVNAVRYGPEGACLMSASYDKTVRCWDLRSRNTFPMQVLTGAADSVSSVAVSDHEVVAGSIDGHVLTFDLRKGEVLRDSMGPPVAHVALEGGIRRAAREELTCTRVRSAMRRTGHSALRVQGPPERGVQAGLLPLERRRARAVRLGGRPAARVGPCRGAAARPPSGARGAARQPQLPSKGQQPADVVA